MKMKTITARVMAVFAAVLLITALSIPAFAASSYVVNCNGSFVYPVVIPEGKYNLHYSYIADGNSIEGYSEVPLNIVYTSGSSGELSWELGFCTSFPVSFVRNGVSQSLMADALISPANESSTLIISCNGINLLMDGATLSFEPVYESPSLTDYIPADTLPTVFNEIIALLPVALGVIVGYIAIRKGISYLQSFLHNS